VQPVAFSDKKQIWLKGIDRNKAFTYEDEEFDEGLGNASVEKIQRFHFNTMSKMFQNLQNSIVNEYNELFKYLTPGKDEVNTYEEGVKRLQDLAKQLKTKDLTEAIYHAVKKAKADGVELEIYQQIHYPVIKGDIQPNETLVA
jgi:DNA-binding transcriptional regulator YhcF (GntR family)